MSVPIASGLGSDDAIEFGRARSVEDDPIVAEAQLLADRLDAALGRGEGLDIGRPAHHGRSPSRRSQPPHEPGEVLHLRRGDPCNPVRIEETLDSPADTQREPAVRESMHRRGERGSDDRVADVVVRGRR